MEYSEILIQNYIEQILILVYRAFHDRRPVHMDVNSGASIGDTTYLMIRYIEDNVLGISNLTEISEHLGYSYNYLSHLFKRKMGVSIQTYLNYKKIAKAIELIDSDRMSITDIAAALNYQTVQAFSKSFKKVMNMSPTDYKKSVKPHSGDHKNN
jgi:AraC-like DNA-binding protein